MLARKYITKSGAKANRNQCSRVAVAASVTISSALGVFSQSGAFASDGVGAMGLQSASEREWAASVRFENDCFGGTDGSYTDGVSLGVSHTGPSWIDPFANWLPWGEGRRTVGYDVTQGMFTPADKSRSVRTRRIARMPGSSPLGLRCMWRRRTLITG